MRRTLACVVFAGVLACMPARADVLMGHAIVTDVERYVGPGSAEPMLMPAPPPDAEWRPATLPAIVPRGTPGGWTRHWYRFRYAYDGGTALAVLLPRYHYGESTALQLRIDGRLVADETTAVRMWNAPTYIEVPQSLLPRGAPRTVELLLGLEFQPSAGYLLASPRVGPASALALERERRAFWMQDAPHVIASALLFLGAFALAVWLRRRQEPGYLLFALATLLWYLRTLHYWATPPAQFEQWFWWLTINSLAWLMVIVYLFAFRFHERRVPWLERVLAVVLAVVALISLPAVYGDRLTIATLAYVVQALVAFGVTALVTRESLHDRTGEMRVLAAALWLLLALGVHDLLLKDWRLSPEGVFLLPYGGIALFGAFLYSVQRRYTGAIAAVEAANAALERRLAERTRELQASHERLRAIEREQTLADERQRLMRDMHDGLGSALMSSLVMVEQGRLAAPEVARVLRECIDDLKLTIDSLEPLDADLVAVLATLRYRLGSRLEAAGVKLEWRVTDLPPLPWLDALTGLQVLRILQEALTNVLKHARARRIVVATEAAEAEVRVRVEDDGVGFDVAEARERGTGRGLLNLHRRAERLGGRLEIESGAGGTRLTLALPRAAVPTGRAPANG